MENSSCSEDSFDAFYKCSCLKMLCPKHYYSHQENFPDHQIDRIKMNVNNESRQILTNLVINFKQKSIKSLNDEDFESYSIFFLEKYHNRLHLSNKLIHWLNLLLLVLAKTKYIFKKIFYTPFEYFLHQPTEKVSKYASDFKFPEDFWNFFQFNYFKFEDKRYIFSFPYVQEHDDYDLPSICLEAAHHLFSCSEIELGYETIQNLLYIREIHNPADSSLWLQFAKIVCDFIKNRKAIKLIEQWKKIEANLPKIYYLNFFILSFGLFKGLHEKGLILYLLEKQENIMQNYDYNAWGLLLLGVSFLNNGNMRKAKRLLIKCIRQFRNSSDIWDLNNVIGSCAMLAAVYFDRFKNQRKVKKIANIVNKIIKSFGKTDAWDKYLLIFYFTVRDWNNAHKIAWKLIKLYEKTPKSDISFSKAQIYLYLSFIYRGLGYNKKILQALANAKSCCGFLPIHGGLCTIYEKLANFEFSVGQYKDAAYYYEQVIKYQDDEALTYSKLIAGRAHYKMKNYDRALQHFIEIENDLLSCVPAMDNEFLFQLYSFMGESYNCAKNEEKAIYYFCKAYTLLNYLKPRDWFGGWEIFWYFIKIKDYEKCEAILEIVSIWLVKSTDLGFKIMVYFLWYSLYRQQNKLEKANIYWEEVEKLFDIEKILLMPKMQFRDKFYILTQMAYVYIYDKHDYFRAEMILKMFETAFDSSIPSNAWYLKFLCEAFLYIYIEQRRLEKTKIYFQKYLNLLKLANKNEVWREKIGISKAGIEERIRKCQQFVK